MDSEDDDYSDIIVEKGKSNAGNKRMSVERIYQKKTQLEHILLRPDTYIGSVETVTQEMWVYDGEEDGLVHRTVTFVPGLYKIFDEILVNAADNKQRDKNMDTIKIEIDPENNMISIYNNGKGIPIVEHRDEKMYVPSLIFGHLLTSSNYNDEEKKVTGGRNGYGAKLCNIFSKKFIVETSSRAERKCFKQIWTENMTNTSEAKITSSTESDYTKITFYPDLSKFRMSSLDRDTVALLSRRAFDVAGSSKGVKVFLNGRRLPVKGFKEYIEMYLSNKQEDGEQQPKFVYENVNDRWEIAVALSEKGFQQVSFVNSIATTKGGRHVDYIADQVVSKAAEIIKKKNKDGIQIKPHAIKSYLFVFVNCLIENPTFDSQTKENMTLQMKNFGSKCEPSEKYFKQVLNLGVVEMVLNWAKFKAENKLDKKCSAKKISKLKNIPKLEDANEAGRKDSMNCTLILTEGDSAKSLVVAGLGVVGRDRYGVFPLRGKMLNVREATNKQILENAEINNIIKIVGLQYKKQYKSVDDLKTLRYGKVMIMTDQDQDGSHIKGLLINFFHSNWPDLLKLPFLEQFITPIVKVSKGNVSHSFYSLPELEEWKKATANYEQWKIKYYKGLGTSTSAEAKEYFSNIERHRIKFRYQGDEDDHSIVLAFSKKMADQRKDWLTNNLEDRKRRREIGLAEQYLYEKNTRQVTYKDFVNKELILFSNLDNERSIPSVIDGLKPGQRKVLFTCFKRNDKREVKVAQLAGSVGEMSAYHHGEMSLMSTIIGLAQDFVGSNNINLLMPLGQFGTRLTGGKDAASPRYIFTMLNSLTRKLFPVLDDPLMNYLFDDNMKVEPDYYVPIIPMVLVNGAEGIGTGWSTKVPNYNPRDLIANIRRLLRKEEIVPMMPWFKGFKGCIEKFDTHRYVVTGEISLLDSGGSGTAEVDISELPLKVWTQNYKENILEPLLNGSEKTPAFITDYREYHTDTSVRFILSLSEANLHKAQQQGIYKMFKLITTFSTASMILFDKSGCIRKYESPEEVLREFFDVRYELYVKRKDYLIGMLEAEAQRLINQARFIMEKIEGKIKIENVKKREFIRLLIERKYDSDPVKIWRRKNGIKIEKRRREADEEAGSSEDENNENGVNGADDSYDFDYLIDMKIRSMLKEKVEELLRKRDLKREELEALRAKSIEELWETDLDAFLAELERIETEAETNSKKNVKSIAGAGKGKSGKPVKSRAASNHMNSYLEKNPGERISPESEIEVLKKEAAKTSGKAKRATKKEGDLFGEDDVPLTNRIGTSPQLVEEKKSKDKSKMKQTTLNFKPVSKSTKEKSPAKKKATGKRKKTSDSEESGSEFEISDNGNISESDMLPLRERANQRSTSKKVIFNFDDSDGEENNANHKNNVAGGEQVTKTAKATDSKPISLDSDEDDYLPFKEVDKPKRSSEELFDAFIKQKPTETEPAATTSNGRKENGVGDILANVFDDDDDVVPLPPTKKAATSKSKAAAKEPKETKKKAPAKRQAKPKAAAAVDGDSPIKAKKTSKKRVFSSDEDDFIPVGEKMDDVRAGNRPGRSKARVVYNFDDESDEDM